MADHLGNNMAEQRRTLRRDGRKKNDQIKEFIQRPDDPPGFRVEKFENKGRGVVTEIRRKKGDFLLVYRGENISAKEGDRREEEKSSGYRFFFHSGGKRLCIDATKEDKTLGRLVNHGEKWERNCVMKECFGSLCLFAMRDIEEGDELLYDYGLKKLPWQQVKFGGHVVVMKAGCEVNSYPMNSTVLAIGSMPLNCIIVKEATAHEAILEVNMSGEVFLVHRIEEGNAEIQHLKDGELFKVGKRTFKWKYMYPNQSQIGNRSKQTSNTPKDKESCNQTIDHEDETEYLEMEYNKQISNPNNVESCHQTTIDHEDKTENLEMESNKQISNPNNVESCHQTTIDHKDKTENLEMESNKQISNPNNVEFCHQTTIDREDETDNPEMESNKQISNPNNVESCHQTTIVHEDDTENIEMESNKQISYPKDVESCHQTTIDNEDKTENLEMESNKQISKPNDVESCNQTTKEHEDETENLEIESNKQISNDCEEFTSDRFSESDQEAFDDSVNDPDYVETGHSDSYEDIDYDLSNHDNDLVPYSSSDVSDTIPQITDLQALKRKDTSVNDYEENPQKRKRQGENTSNHSLSSANITVQATNNTVGRKWDKKEYCLYCSKGSTNVTKHFLKSHKTETEVKQILDLPKGSKQRSQEILRLRRAGNYQHNCSVLKEGKGEIVVVTRPNVETKPEDYLPCEGCLGFFIRESLWRHKKVCPFVGKGRKSRNVQAEANLLLPSSIDIHEGLKSNVFSKMLSDEITFAARGDKIIVKIGEKLYQKHRHLPHLSSHISQKMREIGRFLICAREQDSNIIHMSDILVPEKFPLAVKTAKILCKFNEVENSFGNPSLALKLGHILKKCAKLLKSEALINGDTELGRKADGFLTL